MFTVEAGRQIYFDGKPFMSIGREGKISPSEADMMVHIIAEMLNDFDVNDLDSLYREYLKADDDFRLVIQEVRRRVERRRAERRR